MRRIAALVLAGALLGGLVGGGVVLLSMSLRSASPRPPAAVPQGPTTPTASATAPQSVPAGAEWGSPLGSAEQLVAAGRLREAQEEYLAILLIEPTNEEANRGLVRVVGLIARGDRALLRRQAERYRRAIELGTETEEHYTAPAMELLARASLQAAGVRTAVGQPRTPPGAPAPPSAGRSPAPSRPETPPQAQPARPPARPATPQPAPTPGSPAPAAQPAQSPPSAQPAPPPPVNPNEPFVTVVIGPFGTSERASAITGELTVAGYAARLRQQGAGSYIITLGPYRQSEAARAAGYVRSRFGARVPVALTPVR